MCKADVNFSKDEVDRGFWNSKQSSKLFLLHTLWWGLDNILYE